MSDYYRTDVGAAGMILVVRPDGTRVSSKYYTRNEAEELVDYLNIAYQEGRNDAIKDGIEAIRKVMI